MVYGIYGVRLIKLAQSIYVCYAHYPVHLAGLATIAEAVKRLVKYYLALIAGIKLCMDTLIYRLGHFAPMLYCLSCEVMRCPFAFRWGKSKSGLDM